MSEKSCDTCLYQGPFNKDECYAEQCDESLSGWRGKLDTSRFVDQIEEILPKKKLDVARMEKELRNFESMINREMDKFSLNKLIDDHWQYNKGLIGYCLPYGVDGWETDDILRLVEFAYKQSGKHFWKHCKEHYNIKDTDNE